MKYLQYIVHFKTGFSKLQSVDYDLTTKLPLPNQLEMSNTNTPFCVIKTMSENKHPDKF